MLPQTSSFYLSALLALHINVIAAGSAASYAPTYVDCPSNVQWLREATHLNTEEYAWVQGRKQAVTDALEDYLERVGMEHFSPSEYIKRLRETTSENSPIIAFAISGGGWRSALGGTGAYRALDGRLDAASKQRTGGLLQALTYTTGLSGGSWPTFSLPLHGFPTIDELTEMWQPWRRRFDVQQNTKYAATPKTIFGQIADKAKAGFPVSMGDFFGREFAYEFVPGEKGGITTTVSGIAKMEMFKNFSMPMPMGVISEVLPGDDEYFGFKVPPADGSAILYEISPFEFGAWKGPRAFTPTEFLGTRLEKGAPKNKKKCVNGFDNAGFILGTCGSAANFWYIEGLSNGSIAGFGKRSSTAIEHESTSLTRRSSANARLVGMVRMLGKVFQKYFHEPMTESISTPWPNPFYKMKTISSNWYSLKDLTLVDGSETQQAIPLWPLLQPQRNVSLIFAWDDAGGETPLGWNNGTNLYNTYLAATTAQLPFPIIPPVNTLVNKGFNLRPTFFGCDPLLTNSGDSRSPIVVWISNAPYSAYSNYTWSDSTFTRQSMQEIYTNSFNVITQGNGTWDHEWPACIACAVVERSLEKVGLHRSEQCDRCFAKYCWNGDFENGPTELVDPSMALHPTVKYAEWEKHHAIT